MKHNQSTIASLCERPFSPQVTMSQIIEEGNTKFWEWNVRQEILTITNQHDEVVGMFLKLDNKNYNDMVFITLGWEDLYHIRFMNSEGEMSHEVEGLYHDQLFEVIDRYINSLTPKIVPQFSLN